jgi:hypothetical protein
MMTSINLQGLGLGVEKGRLHGGIQWDYASKMFTKFVNKNAIKPEKGVPSAKKFHSPYIPCKLRVFKD